MTLISIEQYHMNQDLYHGQVSAKHRRLDPGFQQLNTPKFLLRLFRIMHGRGTDQILKQAEEESGCVPFLHIYNAIFIMIVLLDKAFLSLSIRRNFREISGHCILCPGCSKNLSDHTLSLPGSFDFVPINISCDREKAEEISVLCHNRRNISFHGSPPGR